MSGEKSGDLRVPLTITLNVRVIPMDDVEEVLRDIGRLLDQGYNAGRIEDDCVSAEWETKELS